MNKDSKIYITGHNKTTVIPRLDRGVVIQGCTVYEPKDGIQCAYE